MANPDNNHSQCLTVCRALWDKNMVSNNDDADDGQFIEILILHWLI